MSKGNKLPATRQELTPQQKAARTRAENNALMKAKGERLAQIANLIIAGYDIDRIAAETHSTPAEIERMITADMSRFVRTQPALRIFVRNYISKKYTELLDAVWDEATDKTHTQKLEHQDRALKILREMERLHGAAAPTQSEVKIESTPEAVEKVIDRLSAMQGLNYDVDVFDVVDAEIVHEADEQAGAALAESWDAVESDDTVSGNEEG